VEYVGLQTQIWRNNSKSTLLLLAFPLEILGILWILIFSFNKYANENPEPIEYVNQEFLLMVPYVFIGVGIWFFIAWFSHSAMIRRSTGSKSLERKENMRVYNLVENLCMSRGMKTPKIYVIEDSSLNAFASGLSTRTYAISLSRGIIDKLDDDELEAVIAHELSHIINKDVRLLIISIIFVGIFSFFFEMVVRSTFRSGSRSRSSSSSSSGKKGGAGALILIIIGLAIVAYLLSLLLRFAISRKREYMADAGAAELTKNPNALASALRKISEDPWIEAVKRDDVAQMFIEHPTKKKGTIMKFLTGFFASHPPIKDRIEVLEQF
jgi:heat shock protein HtpX